MDCGHNNCWVNSESIKYIEQTCSKCIYKDDKRIQEESAAAERELYD